MCAHSNLVFFCTLKTQKYQIINLRLVIYKHFFFNVLMENQDSRLFCFIELIRGLKSKIIEMLVGK